MGITINILRHCLKKYLKSFALGIAPKARRKGPQHDLRFAMRWRSNACFYQKSNYDIMRQLIYTLLGWLNKCFDQ